MSLKAKITEEILQNGPMLISEYMARCNAYYYANAIPFGAEGDFITAPDISQMFGELVGLWFADLWLRAGGPAPFRLVELGPGRGTLMADALRATKNIAGFHDALDVHFVETSPILRAQQNALVPDAQWHDSVRDLLNDNHVPLIIIANEFFDALGVDQMIKQNGTWQYRVVDVTPDGNDLYFRTLIEITHDALSQDHAAQTWPWCDASIDEPEGTIRERQNGLHLMNDLSFALESVGGAMLILDYGYTRTAPGDTLQAMRNHGYVDPLIEPGLADLTAHVDFQQLSHPVQFSSCKVHGPTTQGSYLRKLGLDARAATLARANSLRSNEFIAQAARLADSDQMGTLFKVICLTSENWPTPAGFEP
jgi:NADH dehydrogenase [ubiquinone] 1 alpha subcomplex assembly factor 7